MSNYRDPITHTELHSTKDTSSLNWLRAAVLGANDGIVSISSIVVGVAASGAETKSIATAGVAAVVAGALSMAVGEFVSVSTQRDTEKALIAKERFELEHSPEAELNELITLYEEKGLQKETAELVAKELTAKDAFKAHADVELALNPDELTNPWHAAYASALAFFSGAIIPLIVILIVPKYKIIVTFIAVVLALMGTGLLSAHVVGANKRVATMRVVVGGLLAMLITFGIGKVFGTTLG